jgi:hypothetical protein
VSIGDVKSNERGSGARYNDGKAKLEYVPARVLLNFYAWRLEAALASNRGDEILREKSAALDALEGLARFEEGDTAGLCHALDCLGPDRWKHAAAQFDFGAKKYAAWNWAKGMPWSVPGACIKRHAVAIFSGESLDLESGVPHLGAIGCNLVMLMHFVEHYREGDDRPPAQCFSTRPQTDAEVLRDYLTKGLAVTRVDPAAFYKPAENARAEGERLEEPELTYATAWSQEGKL